MIQILQGDITESDCEAIVNAANNDLKLGSGVAGAIRKKGGPSIQEECDRIGRIAIGEAALTGGGNLKAKYVIHAASMGFLQPTTEQSLKSSVEASLRICSDRRIASVAFPALGTGVSGFPVSQCAEIMIAAIQEHLHRHEYPRQVQIVLWDDDTLAIFQQIYRKLS